MIYPVMLVPRRPHPLKSFGAALARILLCLSWSALACAQEITAPPAPPPPAPPPPTLPAPTASPSQASAPSRDDEPSSFRITGRVVNSITKAAVSKAELTVLPMGVRRANARFAGRSGTRSVTALTDANGRFEIALPSAGGWSVTAAAHGYHTQAFEEHDGFSTAVILTSTKPEFSLTFPLTPAASIEGYVLDEAGEAVRNAQLTLSLIPPATPEDQHPRRQGRGNQRTDDRGYFKFSGLLSGSYGLRLQAHPWYASSATGNRSGGLGAVSGAVRLDTEGPGSGGGTEAASAVATSAPDPLDVVYPIVWYPGVSDFAAATPITLRGGETREADLRLLPIPGFHLRITARQTTPDGDSAAIGGGIQPNGRGIRNSGYLSQVLPDGTEAAMPVALHTDASGNAEYSGLAPGTYVLHRENEFGNGNANSEIVHISANSARTIDISQADPQTLVTVRIDGAVDKPSLRIDFRDVETGRVSYATERQNIGAAGPHRGSPAADAAPVAAAQTTPPKDAPANPDRTVSLYPGRYEVLLNGGNDLHLTSIETQGATATGRLVTIAQGSPVLTLHVASGRATLTGFVLSNGKPIEGAMVLLVPSTLGDPSGLDLVRRDQSNTDGSYDMPGVLPGTYILVAIDHGWDVNWSDPATLRRFLIHGLPLDLSTGTDRKATIEAQSP